MFSVNGAKLPRGSRIDSNRIIRMKDTKSEATQAAEGLRVFLCGGESGQREVELRVHCIVDKEDFVCLSLSLQLLCVCFGTANQLKFENAFAIGKVKLSIQQILAPVF